MNLISKVLFFLSFLAAFGCNSKEENNSYSLSDCEILKIRDSTLMLGYNTIGYKFICKDTTVNEINLLENNPWLKSGFDILHQENPYIVFSKSNYSQELRSGNIGLDLKYSSWKDVKRALDIKSNEIPDSVMFTYALVDCRHNLYFSNYLLINYWLQLKGVADTPRVSTTHKYLFSGNHLEVYSSNGDVDFQLKSYGYDILKPKLDSTYRILVFHTSRTIQNATINGFEIYDLHGDTLLHKVEKDSILDVGAPDLFGDYVLFEILKKPSYKTLQTIIYCISENVLYHLDHPSDEIFRDQIISGNNLFYTKADDKNVPIKREVVNIKRLTILPHTNISN